MELYPSKSVVILLLIVGARSAWCARNDVLVAAIGLGPRTVEGIFYGGYQGGNHNPLDLRATGLETIRTEQGDGGGSWLPRFPFIRFQDDGKRITFEVLIISGCADTSGVCAFP